VFRSPIEEFRLQVDEAKLPVEVVYIERGQTHRFLSREPVGD
jgi:hypothetical protein